MHRFPLLSTLLSAGVAAAVAAVEQKPIPPVHQRNPEDTPDKSCRCFPGDDCWPSDAEWSFLNATVEGRLIATVPLGSPCHDPYYDGEQCAYLREQWLYAGIQYVKESLPRCLKYMSDKQL